MSTNTRAAALAGLLAGATFFAVGWLVATVLDPPAAPHAALGATVVDHTPAWLKDFAISTFGTADKLVLFITIALVSTALAAGLGILAARRIALGSAGVVVLATLCAVAAAARPDTSRFGILPAGIGAVVGVAVLIWMINMLNSASSEGMDRRAFIRAAGAVGAGTALVTVLGVGLSRSRRSVEGARAGLELPDPAEPAPPVPPQAQVELPDMPEFVTPNDEYYRIDTALTVPQIDPTEWELRVHGMVDQEVLISYDELTDGALTEALVTLTCVSNSVGGNLIGNAMWLGMPIRELLQRAGVQQGADMVLSTSADGWTASTPLEALTDDRDALLAIGMNGEPLPVEHGFPVRMVVPGLYGYVSATKWVTELEVTRFADVQAYWTPRGWSERGPIKTSSRIDVPSSGSSVPAGQVRFGGTAWAQHRGITRVQVQIDDGEWQDAELAADAGIDSWRQWTFTWSDATAGSHSIGCRAWDDAEPQTAESAPPAPNGASGYHVISLSVE